MEQIELKNENAVGDKEQEQTVLDIHRMKALMCPEPGCQTFFSSIKSFCAHVAAEHNKQLIEFNAVFPTVEDYQVWLDSLKKNNSGEFSTQRPAQAHPDGSMTGTLYCSQMEKNKNTALSMNSAIHNFDRGCAAHVNFEVKGDRSVVVHAQLAHCGHEVSQIALSALGSRKEVSVKFDELLALYTSVREKLDGTMVSASLNWFEIPKMEVVEEAASNMYYARGIVDEIQSFYQKNPDSRNNPFTTMNQTRSSFVPSIRFQVGEKKRGRPTNAANAHKIAKIRRVTEDSGEVSLEDSGYQPLLIQDEGEHTENEENGPAVDQIIHPRFVANVSDETTEKIDSPQQNLPATRLSDGRVKCPRCTGILKNVASYKGHMRTVHHIRLKAQPRLYRSPMQSLIAQQQQGGEHMQPSSAVQLYSQPHVEDADHVHGEVVDRLSGEAVGVDATVLTPEQVPKSE